MRTILKLIVLLLVAGSLAACSAYDPYRYTKAGALTGAAAGALIGHEVEGKTGAYVGAATGAVVGGSVGYAADQHRRNGPLNQNPYYRGNPPPRDYGYAPPPPPQRRYGSW